MIFKALVFSMVLTTSIAHADGPDMILRALSISKSGISINVPASGCTGKEHIAFMVERKEVVYIKFSRVKEDHCQAYTPAGQRLNYSFKELGIKKGETVVVVNKIFSNNSGGGF